MTKNEAISDIELRLTRGKPSDDLELSRDLIEHWLDTVRDSLVADRLDRLAQAGEPIPEIYIKKLTCNVAESENIACVDDCDQRYTFTLTDTSVTPNVLYKTLDVIGHRGIVRVTTQGGKILIPSSPIAADCMSFLRFSKPSRQNMMFYKEGDEIFIIGLTEQLSKSTKFNVYFVQSNAFETLGDDDEVPIEGRMEAALLDAVEEIGLRLLAGEYEDLQNDGTQA